MADTWQQIAHLLAERLNHATHCERHHTPSDDCPYCADVAAYARYVAKVGRELAHPIAQLRHAVRVDEWRVPPKDTAEIVSVAMETLAKHWDCGDDL